MVCSIRAVEGIDWLIRGPDHHSTQLPALEHRAAMLYRVIGIICSVICNFGSQSHSAQPALLLELIIFEYKYPLKMRINRFAGKCDTEPLWSKSSLVHSTNYFYETYTLYVIIRYNLLKNIVSLFENVDFSDWCDFR